jgi:hypothetical protein
MSYVQCKAGRSPHSSTNRAQPASAAAEPQIQNRFAAFARHNPGDLQINLGRDYTESTQTDLARETRHASGRSDPARTARFSAWNSAHERVYPQLPPKQLFTSFRQLASSVALVVGKSNSPCVRKRMLLHAGPLSLPVIYLERITAPKSRTARRRPQHDSQRHDREETGDAHVIAATAR